MFIAEKKKKENIIEYVLYLFYIEDIVRAFDLDIRKIKTNIIDQTSYTETEKKQLEDWYNNWIQTLQKEQKNQKGHVYWLQEILNELSYLHQMLLFITKEKTYIDAFEDCKNDLVFLHSQSKKDKSDIEVILEALYGKLMLHLQKKSVSEETEKALKKMSHLMGLLAKNYVKLYQQQQS